MLFYYVRHGDPIYDPDSLTPLGTRQAEAVAKRLAMYGVDRIYTSPSRRAVMTSQPTCELLHKQAEVLDFADEAYAWVGLSVPCDDNGGRRWAFEYPPTRRAMAELSLSCMEGDWYAHEAFAGAPLKEGLDRIQIHADVLFASLGYERIPDSGLYRVTKSNRERVALFAHQGFGLAFLSAVLHIPYPLFCTRFDLCHTGLTVIEFRECDGVAYPTVLTHSSDAHLYREGLPTRYNNYLSF